MPYPLVQSFQQRRSLTVAEVALPAPYVGRKFLQHLFQTDPSCPSRQFPNFLLAAQQGLGRNARLATTPLRFTNPSPPSGWVEDFHLQATDHARHTIKMAGLKTGHFLFLDNLRLWTERATDYFPALLLTGEAFCKVASRPLAHAGTGSAFSNTIALAATSLP
jgi:hypothetical protein